jgi:hypothetical protein
MIPMRKRRLVKIAFGIVGFVVVVLEAVGAKLRMKANRNPKESMTEQQT